MKREEITIKVEENLCKIRVGDEFPTQRKLFAALDILCGDTLQSEQTTQYNQRNKLWRI